MNYSAKLAQRIESVGSRLCVGIDPRPELSGGIDAVPEYLKRIVGETAEYAAAFKPNMAYFDASADARGSSGDPRCKTIRYW